MANDRIFMVCKHCKTRFTMAKYYPSNYGVWWPEELAQFIHEHMGCSPAIGNGNLGTDTCFDLHTEETIDWEGTKPRERAEDPESTEPRMLC